MKKKLLALALTTAMLGSCMIAVPAQAENLCKWGDVTYDLDTGTVTKCETTASGTINILTKINGTTITSIGRNAFSNCKELTSLTIPDGIVSIGEYAFNRCSGLTSLIIPNTVESIGNNAFRYCNALTTITIPYSVTSIGNNAFVDCTKLTSIGIDEENPSYSIENGVLFNKTKTELVCYPAGKTDSVYIIPESVTSISNYAFYHCYKLSSVSIPDSVTTIGEHVFCNCTGLTSVTIPDSVTSIGEYAFEYCSSLTSLTIPDSVTSIGDAAFMECTGLTNITFGNGITSIGRNAFYKCSCLTSVDIPNSVTSIGNYAFCDCSSLNSILFNGTAEQWATVKKGTGLTERCPAKIYVQKPSTETASVSSSSPFVDNSANDGGATGFTAELPASSDTYKLGDVIWQVMSGTELKSTAALSYGDITITNSPVIIGLVITGLYDPDAMAVANYEKLGEKGYIEYK